MSGKNHVTCKCDTLYVININTIINMYILPIRNNRILPVRKCDQTDQSSKL